MDPYYAQLLFIILLALGGAAVLVWAFASRQFRGSDEAAYAVLDGGEEWDVLDAPAAPMSARRRRGMALVLAVVFVGVVASVAFTVVVAGRAARTPAFQRELADHDSGGLR